MSELIAMSEDTKKQNKSCSGCSHCAIGEQALQAGELTGWRLGLSTVAVFLLPWVLALAGALLGGCSGLGQFIGGTCGLLAGAVVAIVMSGVLCKSRREAV